MNPDTVIKLMFCGFVVLVIAVVVGGNLFYKRLLQDTPEQYPRGKVAGKTKEQRNNLIILLFFLLVIIIPGVYLLYKYFDDVLILCPLSGVPLFFSALALFGYGNYRAATLMDKHGVVVSVQVLANYYDTERDYFLIFQPPGADSPHRFVVSQKIYKSITPGQTIQIWYLPEKPTTIRFKFE